MKSPRQRYRVDASSEIPRRARLGGFTLIEMMVVLVIMTIFSALVIPSLINAMRAGSLRDDGIKLCELIRFANVYAISRHHPVQLNINEQNGKCWVAEANTVLPWEENQQKQHTRTLGTLNVSDKNRVSVTFGPDVEQTSGTSTDWQAIMFSSDGHAQDVSIELKNELDETYVIDINGSTGQAVQRDEPK